MYPFDAKHKLPLMSQSTSGVNTELQGGETQELPGRVHPALTRSDVSLCSLLLTLKMEFPSEESACAAPVRVT